MNEYENALEQLVVQYVDLFNKCAAENVILLKKLVDRATPKKAVKMGIDSEYASCPKCGQFVNSLEKFCHCCGQELDWSEENEK